MHRWLGARVAAGLFASLAYAGAGCTGEIIGGAAVDAPDAAPPAPAIELRWLAPAPDSRHAQAEPDARGALAARVDAAVSAPGAARIELTVDGDLAAEAAADELRGTLLVAELGIRVLRATAYAADGSVAATATRAIEVEAPQPADCYAWLDLYRLDYRRGPERAGVSAPVTVAMPINGVVYRYRARQGGRDELFMDCELALSLARAAAPMRRRGVAELVDIGVYNYRCIGNEGTPPDCPRGMSQHAFARALDIAGFTLADGTFYSVNDDWIIDPDDEPTCSAATATAGDAWLHELICELKREAAWNVVLTPNYNAGHRDHFHVDLTEGSDFIRLVGDGRHDCGGDADLARAAYE